MFNCDLSWSFFKVINLFWSYDKARKNSWGNY